MNPFVVSSKEVHPTSITYKIADAERGIVLYKTILHFNQGRAVWKYIGNNDGLLVNDYGIRRAIDRAIHSFNGANNVTH